MLANVPAANPELLVPPMQLNWEGSECDSALLNPCHTAFCWIFVCPYVFKTILGRGLGRRSSSTSAPHTSGSRLGKPWVYSSFDFLLWQAWHLWHWAGSGGALGSR